MLKHETITLFPESFTFSLKKMKLSGNNVMVSHFYVIMFTLKDEKKKIKFFHENDQILSPVCFFLVWQQCSSIRDSILIQHIKWNDAAYLASHRSFQRRWRNQEGESLT